MQARRHQARLYGGGAAAARQRHELHRATCAVRRRRTSGETSRPRSARVKRVDFRRKSRCLRPIDLPDHAFTEAVAGHMHGCHAVAGRASYYARVPCWPWATHLRPEGVEGHEPHEAERARECAPDEQPHLLIVRGAEKSLRQPRRGITRRFMAATSRDFMIGRRK